MPVKIKKGKKKAKVGKIKAGKTKAQYEDELLTLNGQLAEEWTKVTQVRNEKINLEEHLDSKIQDFRDIKNYLNYEIEIEEKEITELGKSIDGLQNDKSNQSNRCSKIIEEFTQRINKELEEQKGEIADADISLKILKHFQNQYQEYIDTKSQVAQEEIKQTEEHTENLYNEKRKFLLEEFKLKKEMTKQVDILLAPIKNARSPEGIENIINLTRNKNKLLKMKLKCASEKYLEMLPNHQLLVEKEKEMILSCGLTEQRLWMVLNKRKLTRKVEKLPKLKESNEKGKTLNKSMETMEETDKTISLSNCDVSEQLEIEKLLNNLEVTATEALNVKANQRKNSLLDESEPIEDISELYERRQNLMQYLAKIIKNYTETAIDDSEKIKRSSTKMTRGLKIPRVIIKRDDFYKTLQQPKQREISKLQKSAGFPNFDCS